MPQLYVLIIDNARDVPVFLKVDQQSYSVADNTCNPIPRLRSSGIETKLRLDFLVRKISCSDKPGEQISGYYIPLTMSREINIHHGGAAGTAFCSLQIQMLD